MERMKAQDEAADLVQYLQLTIIQHIGTGQAIPQTIISAD